MHSQWSPKSTRLHNEMDVKEGKLLSHVVCANNRVTIGSLVRIEIKFSDICEVTQFFFCEAIASGICSFFVYDLCTNVHFLDYKRLVYLI